MTLLARDVGRYAFGALGGYPLRTLLMLLAMAVGVASVVVLTALGEGARRYVVDEFSALGTNLLIVIPGRSETGGFSPGTLTGETPRDLTLEDAQSLVRHPLVRRVAPINVGQAEANWQGRSREVVVVGTTHDYLAVRQLELRQGRFLPAGKWQRSEPVAVIGSEIRSEIFGARPALGQRLRIGDRRFRVVGVLAPTGRSIGVVMDELVIIPVVSAQRLFNTASLFRILVEARSHEAMQPVRQFIVNRLQERHQGVKDVTVITQDAVLATFDRILGALTYAVGGIAAISLGVAGILIMNVMLVAVSQRTAEIGLLKALGASGRQITVLILVEAALLSGAGALLGLLMGLAGNGLLVQLLPDLPARTPLWASSAAVAVAILAGLLFAMLPARRAAKLDPVAALSRR